MSSSGVEMVWLSSCRSERSALAMPAMKKPTAIAEITSAKIDSAAVSSVTMPMSADSLGMRRRKRMSIISQPTLIRMPANAACGIHARVLPSPNRTASSTAAQTTPVTGVRPPERAASSEHGADAAPGNPPIRPAATLPTPRPKSSRSGLWVRPVIGSMISAVSRL